MEEQDYIDYFENLCRQSMDINHEVDGKKSFFYWDTPDNTEELDTAFRGGIKYPALILEAPMGSLNNNQSANYTDTPTGSFTILAKAKSKAEVRAARNLCKAIGVKFLARMIDDCKKLQIVPGKWINFQMDEIPYDTINLPAYQLYGYVFEFRFVCPFGFSVENGTWRDIV